MSDDTKVVRLREGKQREAAQNAGTLMVDPGDLAADASFEDLFCLFYAGIREVCEGFKQPGLALIAIDGTGVAASASIAAKPDRIHVATIGRHGMNDLYLDGDPAISLRHMVAIIYPRPPGADPRFRLVDLRTSLAFLDENGRKLEAVEAEGPLFVRCGNYAIFCFPTGEEIPWPDDPAEGWACIPQRVYLDNEPHDPDRQDRRRLRARMLADQRRDGVRPRRGGTTMVQPFRGPSPAHRRLVQEQEEPLGELVIASGEGRSTIAIGASAAREGVLVGRYDRCDTEGIPALTNPSISRVHLLVIEIAAQLYAIDTASTNGVFADGQETRILPLKYDQGLVLGDGLAQLKWVALN